MFKDGYTFFDNASALNEANKNSRFAHWFYNHTTQRYTDIYLEEDALEDLYFIYGPSYEAIYAQYNTLVGAEPLLPRKGYGFFKPNTSPAMEPSNNCWTWRNSFAQRTFPRQFDYRL